MDWKNDKANAEGKDDAGKGKRNQGTDERNSSTIRLATVLPPLLPLLQPVP